MEQQNPMSEMMRVSMSKIKEMVDVNTIVGEPISTPDGITLIPVSSVSMGFGSAGSDLTSKNRPGFGGGTGAGIRIEPIGFLIIKDGSVRMLNIMPPPNTTLDRVLDMLPTLMDKAEAMNDKRKADKE
ncbi:MAG: sporulation protein YtfJ [Clostridia bacterium]|nr:sporulation protein YtfJ [Clostridia bacterium]